MGVTRIVPDLPVADVSRAAALYAQLFDLAIGMDNGWVGNLGPAERPAVQLQMMTTDASAPTNPVVSIGVASPAEVEDVHRRVLAAGLHVVHPPTSEPWGVYRFFFQDPDGNVVNVVAHLPS
jgi:predicted enzyme related to lactoylglutathione lyase